jgi:hypothetical protein
VAAWWSLLAGGSWCCNPPGARHTGVPQLSTRAYFTEACGRPAVVCGPRSLSHVPTGIPASLQSRYSSRRATLPGLSPRAAAFLFAPSVHSMQPSLPRSVCSTDKTLVSCVCALSFSTSRRLDAWLQCLGRLRQGCSGRQWRSGLLPRLQPAQKRAERSLLGAAAGPAGPRGRRLRLRAPSRPSCLISQGFRCEGLEEQLVAAGISRVVNACGGSCGPRGRGRCGPPHCRCAVVVQLGHLLTKCSLG